MSPSQQIDGKQLGFWASIASLGYVFWVIGGMEMVERLAYYGVKSTAGLYATDSAANGGLGITMTDFGIILTAWAAVQSFTPVLIGGLADRLGYKETIALSTVVKIIGYLVMAWFPYFEGFLVGAVILALGTGIFKPGIQGTLANTTTPQNSSMGWGIFYQTVNIGGWAGPLVAAQLRQLSWDNVFYACAVIISLNFLLLLAYKEPGKEERIARQASADAHQSLLKESIREFCRPIMVFYTLIFAMFWYMFFSLFDVLPVHIRDWVDTSAIVTTLFGSGGTDSGFWIGILGLDHAGTKVMPEGLMNINAGLIMLTCFIVAGIAAKFRTMDAIVAGCLLCSGAMFVIADFHYAWFMALAIAMFSTGEMLASPKAKEFIANIAPPDKKAMYLGFKEFSVGIGMVAESATAPLMYDKWASKETLSKQLLEKDFGWSADQIASIANGEHFNKLVELTGTPKWELTAQMAEMFNIGLVWQIMGCVGICSAIGFYFYGKWLLKQRSLNTATA
ncbi:MFS transporter [Paraferrimonas haliotis]|uniref:MFS transporter n=1 Tax=Paraferrimonas haliotis TaxID=2013866 RepID=A0AA37TQM0_9GAMM|nr:MFS transporter [Paraferrimonas haliotis]GLS83595.1 MFS transporter [Paraferrimonas haliotis]